MKCPEKRTADRWQTADELLATLEPLATPSGGTTPTTTRPIGAAAPERRRPRWLAVATGAGVLLVAGVLIFSPPHAAVLRPSGRAQPTPDPRLAIQPALTPR